MSEKRATQGVANGTERPMNPEATRERRQRLLAMLARAASMTEVEQAVRRLRPQVERTN